MSSRGLVIIPAYNEAHTIAAVLLGLRSAAPNLDRLVVNDGSRDATAQIVAQLGEKLFIDVTLWRNWEIVLCHTLTNSARGKMILSNSNLHCKKPTDWEKWWI